MSTVCDVMTRDVVTVSSATPLKEVARLLVSRRISGVPVVGDDGHVEGVVSEADFLAKEADEEVRHRRLERILGESAATRAHDAKREATTAGEAMTAPAITVPSQCRIAAAAAIMVSRGINRLPVVDDGRLVGIVSRADLVRSFVQPDGELERMIREDVLLRTLSLQPNMFTVDVRDGVATVAGRVERRSEARLIDQAVAMVPGVVDARIDVTWAVDDTTGRAVSLDLVFPFGPR
jgi:CBS domain-containing protein